jgi:hypothetical protein
MFKDLWLGQRSAGLGGDGGCIEDCFSLTWKVGDKSVDPQEEGSLGWAWTTHPPMSTCPLTSPSSTSRESVRPAPCPDSPSPSQKALKVASPTAKARGDPGPAALQDSPTRSGETPTACYKLPPFSFRTLTCAPYPWF